MRVAFSKPNITDADLRYIASALRDGKLTKGRFVEEFETAIAQTVGARYAIATSSGTAALHLALLVAQGAGSPPSRVAVPAYSWVATANAVRLAGAVPVFVDIGYDFNASARKMLEAEADLLLPVHCFGYAADVAGLLASGKFIIEDAACALGTCSEGGCAGTWGNIGIYSFHPKKVITAGEGGMVVTNDGQTANEVRALRNHGESGGKLCGVGFNYRMDEMSAALGLSQLKRLPAIIEARKRIAARYWMELADQPRLRMFEPPRGYNHHAFTVLVDQRDKVAEHMLRAGGVETGKGTVHMPLLPHFGYHAGDFPTTDAVASQALQLPIYPDLTVIEQEQVIRFLKGALRK